MSRVEVQEQTRRSLSVTDRATTFLIQLGLLAVMLVALTYKAFELDRYFVPKELVLNVVALAAAATFVARRRTFIATPVDALLAVFLGWSALSALFTTNYWLAQRALGVSMSSAVIFWAARRLARGGGSRGILMAASIATVVAAAGALLQAYGVDTDLFTLARAPGGTLGNRNFIAHVSAIGLPAIVWCAVTARRSAGAAVWAISAGIVGAALVLSRSRAAWLALVAALIVLALLLLASRKYWRHEAVGGRLARVALAGSLGAILSVALPNTLHWNSDSPYLDSARGVIDYRKGSGGGRIAQYRNSLAMAGANPVFGVGPGNWAVRYVKFAPASDKSLTDDGMTANPWPSSDWVAFVSERGIVAALALLGVFGVLLLGSLRNWKREVDGDAVMLKITLAATISAAMVVSSFDAVLLLPATAFLVWGILGAASGATARKPESASREIAVSPGRWRVIVGATLALVVTSVVRSAIETRAMMIVGAGGHTANWVEAADLDPGSYRLNARVAQLYENRGRCAKALPYARQALELFPSSGPARRLVRRCARA